MNALGSRPHVLVNEHGHEIYSSAQAHSPVGRHTLTSREARVDLPQPLVPQRKTMTDMRFSLTLGEYETTHTHTAESTEQREYEREGGREGDLDKTLK